MNKGNDGSAGIEARGVGSLMIGDVTTVQPGCVIASCKRTVLFGKAVQAATRLSARLWYDDV